MLSLDQLHRAGDEVITSSRNFEYDVALSYAEEDRPFADALANVLKMQEVKVSYDIYEKSILWGENLYTYLSNLYQNKAQYCAMFLSKH